MQVYLGLLNIVIKFLEIFIIPSNHMYQYNIGLVMI